MAALEHLGSEYRDDEWPHGLMCPDCRHVLRDGDRYTERLYAFTDDVPVVEVLCVVCATAAEPGPAAPHA